MNKSESKYFNTAQLMDEALIALLKKKDFEFITVKEICEKAGVNRSTFYLHYENLGDLLAETTEMINKRFQEGYKKTFIDVRMGSVDDVFLITPELHNQTGSGRAITSAEGALAPARGSIRRTAVFATPMGDSMLPSLK